ncbi:MAG: hypothetical protein AAGB46_05380 [Verrucomicrobiota bacterium]
MLTKTHLQPIVHTASLGFFATTANASELEVRDGDFSPSLAPMHHETIELLPTEGIDIYADSKGLRNYAERFAEKVYEAAYETTGEPAGKGLLVIGKASDPHPILLIKQFLEVAEAENQDEEVSIKVELFGTVVEDFEKASKEAKEEIGVEFEEVAHAVPMPLEGVVLNIYLMAKEEDFDRDRIAERIKANTYKEALDGNFENYDWAVYLPPKNAIDKVIREVLPHVMKKEGLGFFKRTLVRGAVATFKPLIRDAMEGVRKSILYDAMLKSTSELNQEDRELLTKAYLGSLMPRGKIFGSDKSGRSLEAIREQKRKNAEYAKDPYIEPAELLDQSITPHSRLAGDYLMHGHEQIRVFDEAGSLRYQHQESDPLILYPVSKFLYTTSDRKMTIEFILSESEDFASAEIRKGRWRTIIEKKS